MPGITYSDLKPEDLCWVIVDGVNSPTGYWRGEVVEVTPKDGWNLVRAIITDPRQDPQSPESTGRRDSYFGREPYLNYSVIPSNQEFDGLVKTITSLEATLDQERVTARTRESALRGALAYAARLGEKELKTLLERKG